MDYRIVLVNGYNATRILSQSLIKKGYKVAAINNSIENCSKLSSIKGLAVFCGDASKPYILEEAYVSNADLVIAMSEKDEDNLVICELCKERFKVKKTVAIITDPINKEFFRAMGIDSVVCVASILSEIIEDSVSQNVDINEITKGLGLDG